MPSNAEVAQMPAETHQHQDPPDPSTVLELLASVLELDDDASTVELASVGIEDELGVLSLWAVVSAELAERTIGEVDLEDVHLVTVGDVAHLFAEALCPAAPPGLTSAG